MLILKSPIKLHFSAMSAAHTEGFAQRILGNYSLLNAHWTAKDLLFLLTSDQEPEQVPSSMTTLVQNTAYHDNQSVTIEVVNQVINRLLLDAAPRLTYQDQVYITSVLNRLGVTDVEQFIQQVRQLRIENESTMAMLALYHEQQNRLLLQHGEQRPVRPRSASPDTSDDTPTAEQAKAQLSLQVFRRLHTAQLSQTIQSFQQSTVTMQNRFAHTEMRLSEHVRLGNSLALAQLKREVNQTSFVHLSHHLNQFEAGLLLPPPKNEEQVLQQAAVSALVSAVDAAFVQVVSRPTLERELWFHTERALQKSAENALIRFERYHTQSFVLERTSAPSAQKALYQYALEMAEYQQTEQTLFASLAHTNIQESRHFETQPLLHRTTLETDVLLPGELESEAPGTERAKESAEGQAKELVQQIVRETAQMVQPRKPVSGTESAVPLQMQHPAPAETPEGEPLPPAQSEPSGEAQPPKAPSGEPAKNFAPFLRHLSPQTVKEMEQHLFREVQRTQLVPGTSPELPEGEEALPSQTEQEAEALREQAKLLLNQMNEVTNAQHMHLLQSERAAKQRPSDQPSVEMVHMPSDAQEAPSQQSERALPPSAQSEKEPNPSASAQQTLVTHQLERLKQETQERVVNRAADQPQGEGALRIFAEPERSEQTAQTEGTRLTEAPIAPEAHVPGAAQQTLIMQQLERFHQEISEMPAHKAAERISVEPPAAPLVHTEQDEPQPVELLQEQLQLFEQRNREMHQLIQQTVPRAPASVQPDRVRTLRQSLRALQAPESVLHEIRAEAERTQRTAPDFTPQELRLLEVSDPQTRELYERILAYQKDPQAAIAQGLVRPASVGELQLELHRAAPEQTNEDELEHVGAPVPQNAQMYTGSLEQVRRASAPAAAPTVYESRAAVNRVRFIHKQQVQEMAQELLEQANVQKTSVQNVTQTDTRATHTRKETTHLSETQTQTVQNMTKDMTELVNQTLQRQMRTISDQVYRQIEKRLALERSRRGRF